MSRRRPLSLIAACAFAQLCLASGASAAVPDVWTGWTVSSGPTQTTIRSLDFTTPATLFASSQSDGVYQGNSPASPWSQLNGGLATPESKSVNQVYAKSGTLWASTSAGLFTGTGSSWTPVGQGPGSNKLNQGGVQAVVQNSPGDIVAAVAGAAPNGIFYSSDNGSTWTRAGGLPTVESVYYLTTGPAGNPIYAAADDGVYQSVNLGRSWVLTSDGIPPGDSVQRVAVAPDDPQHLYAATISSAYVSTNGGATWEERGGSSEDDPADNPNTPNQTAGLGHQFLPSGGNRALTLAPALNNQFGAQRAVIGTSSGVWGTIDDGLHWKAMSWDAINTQGNTANRIIWATALGFSPPSLMAGTSGFGILTTPLQPIEANNAPATTPSGSVAITSGTQLKLNVPAQWWKGTSPFFTTYQWKKCSTTNYSSCTTDIPNANGPSYVVTDADIGSNRFAVELSGRNLVSKDPLVVHSNVIGNGTISGTPASAPTPPNSGPDQPVLSPNDASYPWDTLYTINPGIWLSGGNPVSATFTYQWQRCDSPATNCKNIVGANKNQYTTSSGDRNKYVQVQVTGTYNGVSNTRIFQVVNQVVQKFPVNTVKPKIVGDAYVGRVLSSSAGGWDAEDPVFERRWFMCNEDGLQCNPIINQTGSTYTVKPSDKGSRLELEIKATSPDTAQPRTTTAYSNPTAVITDAPLAPDDPNNPNNPNSLLNPKNPKSPLNPLNKPVIKSLSLTHKRFRVGPKPTALSAAKRKKSTRSSTPVGTTFVINLAKGGTVKVKIEQKASGRRKGKRCVASTRALVRKHAKRCTRYRGKGTLSRKLTAGKRTIPFSGRLGRKALAVGSYRATVSATNLAGPALKTKAATFAIVRR
jgi:hypothetical protein